MIEKKYRIKWNLNFTLIFIFITIINGILFGNGFNLNSIGSRAASMGGAYIGLADDYSAVFWNPAGLTQLKGRTLSFYITDAIPSCTWDWDREDPYYPDIHAKTETRHYLSGLFAYYKPIKRHLTAGIAVYVPSDIGTKWNGYELKNISLDGIYAEWSSRLKVIAISPVLAYRIDRTLAIGAGLNFYYGTLNLKQVVLYNQYSESSSGYGLGFTAGILFTPPDEILSIGLTFKSGYKIRFKGEAESSFLPGDPESNFSREIPWPMSVGWGVAAKPVDGLTITTDFQWTNWSVMEVITPNYENADWQEEYNIYRREFDIELLWDHTLQVRLGCEYQLKERIALRGGYYYDDSPNSGIRLNFLLPSLPHHGITMGIGWRAGSIQYDFGLEYLMGIKQKLDSPNLYPGVHGGNTLSSNFSITYRF